jgi:AraC-like DNA-binding protein
MPDRPPYKEPFNRIYFVHGGEGRIRRNGKDTTLKPGFLYHIPSGSELYLCGALDMDISWAHYDRDPSDSRALAQASDYPIKAVAKQRALIEALFEVLRQLCLGQASPEHADSGNASPGHTNSGHAGLSRHRGTWAEDAALQGIMHVLLEPFGVQSDQLRQGHLDRLAERLEPLFPHIEGRLSLPLRTTELAELAGMETAYFSQMFKEYAGLPPARYVRTRRLEAAARELLRTSRTLKQIAETCGFCDAYHLAKAFKAEMGVNPGEYRKRGVLP